MKVGIPKGLMYYKYHPFYESFFKGLGADVITSPDTNKNILNSGIKTCVDEACLPVKIFHGHVFFLKDKCDIIFIPRIMQLKKREYICPKFCGLPEMITSSIPDLPKIISTPIYATSYNKIYKWAVEASKDITIDKSHIKHALNKSLMEQKRYDEKLKSKINSPNNNNNNIKKKNIKIALTGHPYNINDDFVNMNIIKKLNALGAEIIREESQEESLINYQIKSLYKNPFWTFARKSYGFISHSFQNKMVDGVIYISSFACGIDSVIIELVKDKIGDFPFMVIKVDEQTGEAGLNTRIEAFVDMLERKIDIESNISAPGQCAFSNEKLI